MKRILKLILLICALFVLCSCSVTVDDLYQPPQLSGENAQLQELIDDVLNLGASYSAPSSGSHRQSVQLEDLDNDGQHEALAFFRVANDDKPLNIYIFRKVDGEYVEAAKIEGEGETIDSISYSDMDNDGQTELIIGWQISTDIKLLTIYSISDFQPYLIGSTNYTDYALCNLSVVGENVFVIRMSPSEQTGEADLYTLFADGELNKVTTPLSVGINAVSRIQTSPLLNGTNAVYVDCSTDNGMLTDIFTFQMNEFKNITCITSDPTISGTYRTTSTYCTDINEDKVLDIPISVPLTQTGDSTTTYYATHWYSYSSSGRQNLTLTTYHNYTDGWYFVLDDAWTDQIAIRREISPGTRSIVFSVVNSDSTTTDFLTISSLSGDNKEDNAILGNRFQILATGEVTYTGEIVSDLSLPFDVTEELVAQCFHLIYSDWVISAK